MEQSRSVVYHTRTKGVISISAEAKAKNLVFDTIAILAVWPISVSYRHSVVDISVGFTDYVFCLADELAGTPFLNNLVGTPIFLKKVAQMN